MEKIKPSLANAVSHLKSTMLEKELIKTFITTIQMKKPNKQKLKYKKERLFPEHSRHKLQLY